MKLEARVVQILRILNENSAPLSSMDIAKKYIENPTSSDALTTGNICHVLSLVDMAKRLESYRGKSLRVSYQKFVETRPISREDANEIPLGKVTKKLK